MRVQIDQILTNALTGKPHVYREEGAKDEFPMTLKWVIYEALDYIPRDAVGNPTEANPVKLTAMWDLQQKLMSAADGQVDFTVEQLAMLKDRISKRFPVASIAGAAFFVLDPPPAPKAKAK